MAKGVSNLYRYAEIGSAANHAYMEALSVVADLRPAKETLEKLTAPVIRNGKGYGSFNPAKTTDMRLFSAVLDGKFIAFGFQNRDIRLFLWEKPQTRKQRNRLSVKTGRLLKKLQMHGLIAKVSRSRRWKVTLEGRKIMQTSLMFYNEGWPQLIERQAA